MESILLCLSICFLYFQLLTFFLLLFQILPLHFFCLNVVNNLGHRMSLKHLQNWISNLDGNSRYYCIISNKATTLETLVCCVPVFDAVTGVNAKSWLFYNSTWQISGSKSLQYSICFSQMLCSLYQVLWKFQNISWLAYV